MKEYCLQRPTRGPPPTRDVILLQFFFENAGPDYDRTTKANARSWQARRDKLAQLGVPIPGYASTAARAAGADWEDDGNKKGKKNKKA